MAVVKTKPEAKELKSPVAPERSLEEAKKELEALESGNKVRMELALVEKRIRELKRLPETGTYRLTQPLYRQGMMYLPGEYVSIVNEVPGKTWVKVEDVKADKEELERQERLAAANQTSDVVALSEMTQLRPTNT